MFLEILREARRQAFTKHNIKRSWEKTGLFPFDPEVVISSLPVIILQREEEVAKSKVPKPPSRPTTSGQLAPLIIDTPIDISAIKVAVEVSFKSSLDSLKNTLGMVNPLQD